MQETSTATRRLSTPRTLRLSGESSWTTGTLEESVYGFNIDGINGEIYIKESDCEKGGIKKKEIKMDDYFTKYDPNTKKAYASNKKIEEIDNLKKEDNASEKIVCAFPFEFNPDSYTEENYQALPKEQYEFYKGIMEHINFKECDVFKNNELDIHKIICFNPFYFLKTLNDWGMFEFNPYERAGIKTYKIDGVTYEIKNNPGFILSNSYTFTQSFNYPYTPNTYCHEGVDIAVSYNDCGKIAIISGIHGKVILEGDKEDKSYGCFIVIKAETKFDGKYRYYLLAHLDRTKIHKHEKQDIFPGEIVGYVGNTGHCKGHDSNGVSWNLDGENETAAQRKARKDGVGSHLHLQLYLSNSSVANFLSETESGLAIHKNDGIKIAIKDKGIVNPFDYNDNYIRDTKK